MRKGSVIWILLIALAIGILPWAHGIIDERKDDVEISEEVLMGDPAAASGLVVKALTHVDQRLFWETIFRPGSGAAAVTEFEFTTEQRPEYYGDGVQRELYVSLAAHHFVMGSNSSIEELESDYGWEDGRIWEPAVDVAKRAPAGENYVETVRLRDYCDVYPITIDYIDDSGIELKDHPEVFGHLTNFFAIPVPEDIMMEIAVQKDSAGNVKHLSSSLSEGTGEGEGYREIAGLEFSGILTDDGGYVIVSGGEALREDNGIYFFPMTENRVPDMERLGSAFLLEDGVDALQLYHYEEADQLILLTEGNGQLRMTVIDRKSMEELQRIDLGEIGDAESIGELLVDEGIMIITVRDMYIEERELVPQRMVLLENRGGIWFLEMRSSLNWPEQRDPEHLTDVRDDAELIWDGRRLGIVQWSRYHASCDIYVMVCEENQLKYAGAYHRNDTNRYYYHSSTSVTPWTGEDGLKAHWE